MSCATPRAFTPAAIEGGRTSGYWDSGGGWSGKVSPEGAAEITAWLHATASSWVAHSEELPEYSHERPRRTARFYMLLNTATRAQYRLAVFDSEAVIAGPDFGYRRSISRTELSTLYRAAGLGAPLIRHLTFGPLAIELDGIDAGQERFDRKGPSIRISIRNTGSRVVLLRTTHARELAEWPTIVPNDASRQRVSLPKPVLPIHHPIHSTYVTTRLAPGEAKVWFVDLASYLLYTTVIDPSITYEVTLPPWFSYREEGDSDNEAYEKRLARGRSQWDKLGIPAMKLTK